MFGNMAAYQGSASYNLDKQGDGACCCRRVSLALLVQFLRQMPPEERLAGLSDVPEPDGASARD